MSEPGGPTVLEIAVFCTAAIGLLKLGIKMRMIPDVIDFSWWWLMLPIGLTLLVAVVVTLLGIDED